MRMTITLLLALWLSAALAAMCEQNSAGQMPSKKDVTQAPGQPATGARDLVVDGKVVGQVVAARPGEICLVCNAPIQAADLVYVVRGQRIPVHQGHCNDELRARPQQWLARLLSSNTTPQPPKELIVDGKVVGRLVPAKPAEICLVCNEPLHSGDVVYLVYGQRVPIHLGACDSALRAQPQHWLAQLRPRGAFLGAEADQRALSAAWFFVGSYVLLGLIFAALCAHQALHAGRSAYGWFAVGLVLNALGYLILLTRPKREVLAPAGVPRGLAKIASTYSPQPCPMCGAENHPAASECIACGAKLTPAIDSEVKRAGLRPN